MSTPAAGERVPPAWIASALRDIATGKLAPGTALVRLVMAAETPASLAAAVDEVRTALAQDGGGAAEMARLDTLVMMARSVPGAWGTVRRVAGAVDHAPDRDCSAERRIAKLAASFDAAAAICPEASVALHSLGDPSRLTASTDEIVARMAEWGLLGPGRDAVEIGCGIGRFQLALAARLRHCIGIDISDTMLAEASRRCAGLANVRIRKGSGLDLAGISDRSLDLVFAVDSFPYLVLAGIGVAARHVTEAARVLRPGGDLLILNLSYRGDDGLDRRDLASWAEAAGFRVLRDGLRPFALWDGTAYHLVRERRDA